jgi:hypothetical protein
MSRILLVTFIKLSFSAFFTILLPLLIYISFLIEPTGFENYILRWEFLLAPLVVVGCVIFGFLLITRLQDVYKLQWLLYSIITEVVYIIQIIMWSNLLIINFEFGGYLIILDLSLLYDFLIFLPILLIIRNLFIFRIRKKDFLYKVLVLKAIRELKKPTTKTQIRRYISNKIVVDNEIKTLVLRNFSNILSNLLERTQPLIKKNNNFHITKEGLSVLRYYEASLAKRGGSKDLKIVEDEEFDPANLEVWTEEELKKLKQ